MKRLVGILALVLVVVAVAEAKRKKDPAGSVSKDLVFTDDDYAFQLKLGDNWKANPGKSEDHTRLVLIQKVYGTPDQFRNNPSYTLVPRVVLYVDTTAMSVNALLDSLLSPSFNSKQKKEMLREFEFLKEKEIIPKNRRPMTIAGESGVVWEGTSKYTRDIPKSVSGDAVERVAGGYGGGLILVKHGNVVLVFHVMTEMQFFNDVFRDVQGMVAGIIWGAAKP